MENNEHYLLHCKLFVNQRNVMMNNIRDLGLDISINNILYGNSDFAYDVNCSILQLFINTYTILKDLFDVYVLLNHLRSTTQHQSQYILQYYVIFLT
jgi:hypothetical protein